MFRLIPLMCALAATAAVAQKPRVVLVPFAHGETLYNKMRATATHRGIPGGNHHLNNIDRAAVVDDIVAWLKSH